MEEFLKFGRFKRECVKIQGGACPPAPLCRRPWIFCILRNNWSALSPLTCQKLWNLLPFFYQNSNALREARAVAGANEERGTSQKFGGTKIDWTFAHKNWYFMAKILYSCIKKETCRLSPAAFIGCMVSYAARSIAWKICLQEWIRPEA